jgi:hypothetical protein
MQVIKLRIVEGGEALHVGATGQDILGLMVEIVVRQL